MMILLASFTVTSAYIIGVSVSVVLILVAAISSMSISYRPDLTDVSKRKVLFWILAILCPVLTFVIGYFTVYNGIKVHTQQTPYMTAMGISAAISFVLYIVLGFIAAKINKTGKIGNWF